MIDYQEFLRLFDAGVQTPGFIINFKGVSKEYIIIKYSDCVQFSRCGIDDSTCEYFQTIEVLMEADQVDGINLKRDWNNIERIYPEGYDGTFEMYCEYHGIDFHGELISE